jgi:hypothetical protein
MARRKILILAGFSGAVFILTVVAAYVGLSSGNHDSPGEGQHTAPTSEATPEHGEAHGTDHAVPLAASHDEVVPQAAVEEGGHFPVPKAPLPTKIEARTGPAHDAAESARNNLSPEAGLHELDKALALPHNQEQAALLHEARGELYAQLDPPDFTQARAAFEKALEMTSDGSLEEEIRHKAVQMHMMAGQDAEALKMANAQLDIHRPMSGSGFKLQLLKGQLLERAGETDKAESNYRAVFEAMEAVPEFLGVEENLSLARLAALRLTQLYRQGGRTDNLEEVANALRKQVGRMQGDSQS